MSDVESDLPPELDIDLNNVLDNVMNEPSAMLNKPLAEEAMEAAIEGITEDDDAPISTLVDEDEEEEPKKE